MCMRVSAIMCTLAFFMNVCVKVFPPSRGSPCGLCEEMLCGHAVESFAVQALQ